MALAELQPIAISALQHFAYCPRQFALIHLDQVWSDNYFTAQGNVLHERVDSQEAEVTPPSGRLQIQEKAFHECVVPYPVERFHGQFIDAAQTISGHVEQYSVQSGAILWLPKYFPGHSLAFPARPCARMHIGFTSDALGWKDTELKEENM